MTDKNVYDAAVIGAGPVGSFTAYLLAREGFRVCIFEKNSAVGRNINCTGIISPACLKKCGLPDGIVLKTVDSIRAISPSGDCLRYQSGSPLAFVVDRRLFDGHMNEKAVGEGVSTFLNARVTGIEFDPGGCGISVIQDGTARSFRAKVAVSATGFELSALKGIKTQPIKYLYGIQSDISMDDVHDIEVYLGKDVSPGSFGWVVPTTSGCAKIGLMTKNDPLAWFKKLLRHPLVARRVRSCDNQVRCSPIPMKPIARSFGERYIIVGEAAGQVKSTTGGGIYFGLLCAEIGAETIKKAFRTSDYSERVFREYEIQWKRKIDPELKAGTYIRTVFSRLSDRQIDMLIDLAKKDGILPMLRKTHFDWHKDLIAYVTKHLIAGKLFGRN
ncbi:MAG: geranylgeranyl reductase family protein [Nitrospirota bacterium]